MDMVVTETTIVLSVSFIIDNVQYKLETKLFIAKNTLLACRTYFHP